MLFRMNVCACVSIRVCARARVRMWGHTFEIEMRHLCHKWIQRTQLIWIISIWQTYSYTHNRTYQLSLIATKSNFAFIVKNLTNYLYVTTQTNKQTKRQTKNACKLCVCTHDNQMGFLTSVVVLEEYEEKATQFSTPYEGKPTVSRLTIDCYGKKRLKRIEPNSKELYRLDNSIRYVMY